MSNVADGSMATLGPASTIVSGLRAPERTEDAGVGREKCMWFEKKLKLKDYLRDKENEERSDTDERFIRVNSKTLLTSYRIQAFECRDLLKRLYRLLSPGLASKHHETTKAVCNRQYDERERRHRRILHDWLTYSDFTVQVVPRYPTVFWLDLECMSCKNSSGRTREKHFKSKKIIESVVSVVLDNVGSHASIDGKCDRLYVTRGRTCGMHMFFPQVSVPSEFDGQEVWAAVNRRLAKEKHRSATVDTGCSSMPLPLARFHNGLTRVDFTRDEITGELKIHSYEVSSPTIDDLVNFTNFSHLVRFENTESPPPSVVTDSSLSGIGSRPVSQYCVTVPTTTTTITTTSDTERTAVGDAALGRTIEQMEEREQLETTAASDENNDSTHRSSGSPVVQPRPQREGGTSILDSRDSNHVRDVRAAVESTDTPERADPPSSVQPDAKPTETSDGDDRSSSVSSTTSSKRLKQTDIRDLCANATVRRSRTPSRSDSEHSRKRPRIESVVSTQGPIVIDDEDDGNDSPTRSESVTRDDTTSSFLCDGYVPSIGRYDSKSRTTYSDITSHSGRGRLSQKSSRSTSDGIDGPTVSTLPIGESAERGRLLTSADAPPRGAGTDCTEEDERLRALHVTDDTIPGDARLPDLMFRNEQRVTAVRGKTDYLTDIARARETFEQNMRLDLDSQDGQTHETDTQLLVSGFNAEMNFYTSILSESTPVDLAGGGEYDGLRLRRGSSLQSARENCPNSLFPEYVPFVLSAEDFVTETDWITVLVRYFDEYLNNAPCLHVMSHVLSRDETVKRKLNVRSRTLIERSVNNCLARFRMDAVRFQEKMERRSRTNTILNAPKHPYEEKCTVVIGLIAVCSSAYNIITPIFTDLARTCRLLLGNSQQTLEILNSSTMATVTGDGCHTYSPPYVSAEENVDCLFEESVSCAEGNDVARLGGEDTEAGKRVSSRDAGNAASGTGEPRSTASSCKRDGSSAHIGNEHSIIASVLRWNYPALADQTLWGLFFYYYHVHSDGLTRIMDEVVHGGLMVTALLQAYIEDFANNAPVDVRMVCGQTYGIYERLKDKTGEMDRALMPPPKGRGGAKRKTSCSETRKPGVNSAQSKVTNSKNGRRKRPSDGHEGENEDEAGAIGFAADRKKDDEDSERTDGYFTSFDDVLFMIVHRYLRPVTFDETTVVYTESGYEQNQNEIVSYFAADKDRKRSVTDMFSRSTLKYSMPHGDLLLYNTDVMGTIHRRSSCTNNLVLNVFENMYGGCMSYLTRRFNNHLKIFNRFNGDAYRLVVECRHAMTELVRSVELSYVNLILRQPVVPPVLEPDIAVRQMYMSREEILKGAFVCLNTMDYVRSINMFTRHSKHSRENCRVTESFLDQLIVNEDLLYGGIDEDARTRFRTIYLFYQLFVFEVLYKIRHAFNRNGSYCVSVERLSWEIDVRLLLKLFFGAREFKTPRGLSQDALKDLGLSTELYGERPEEATAAPSSRLYEEDDDDYCNGSTGDTVRTGTRCINTRPLVSVEPPNKMARMAELFGKKGIAVMKSYAPLAGNTAESTSALLQQRRPHVEDNERKTREDVVTGIDRADSTCSGSEETDDGAAYEELDRTFLGMSQAQLEEALYSNDKWYDNCRIRVRAVRSESRTAMRSEKHLNDVNMCMDSSSLDTFLSGQLRTNIDNDRLGSVERYVRQNYDFAFCTHLPLRVKMMALVLATHSLKRLTTDVASDFVRKEYRLERLGVVRFNTVSGGGGGGVVSDSQNDDENDEYHPDREWERNWSRLLSNRRSLLIYCRSLADNHFADSYFIGLHPDNAYHALYNYMSGKAKYVTLQTLRHQPWAKDVCVALNYLLVMNAYDPELVELCLRLFLGFEWPGQWAKRIFVWKSNSNAGKSYLFEHVLRKAFDQSTCINDPKGGKDNAPEKSEYYKNFVLMINEFSSASAGELKKLCSTSSYKFRMNFGNHMIQAFMVGKMVFNCNTLPLTTDHATIQRVALVPLPFWFQKRQSVVDAMLNWTRGHLPVNDYERNFRRNISQMLLTNERRFFIENVNTRYEGDLFNRPNDDSQHPSNSFGEQNAKASMFLVQNKTSQVYMLSGLPTGTIISGIVSITRYFCRFRFFNNIKEPVDYSVLPSACNHAAQEWQRISQPYFEWKEKYQVQRDSNVRTKVSTILASINHFAKNRTKNVSFFDLRQFFEWDFAEQKIPYYNAKEDEYYVRIDPIQD